MPSVHRSFAVMGVMVALDQIGKVEERKPSCEHPQRRGNNFCPVCGVPSVDGWTRKDAFHQKIDEAREALADKATIGFTPYHHDDDERDPRWLIGSTASTDGDEYSYAASIPPPDMEHLSSVLRTALEPLGLWPSGGVRLHVLMRADG